MSTATHGQNQTAMKRLAGALAFVCLVLLVVAVDPGHAADAWRSARDAATPVAGRLWDWARGLPSGGDRAWADFRDALRDDGAGPLVADAGPALLAGEFRPADDATRATTGGATFVGAAIRFENGETLHTTPMRIAAGRDAFAHGRTFAAELEAAADAQIETRRVIPAAGARAAPASALCGGDVPAVVAVLHRRRQVDVMLFRQGLPPGPEAPADRLCGAWRYRR